MSVLLLTLTHPFKITYPADFAKIDNILGELEVEYLILTYVPSSVKIVLIGGYIFQIQVVNLGFCRRSDCKFCHGCCLLGGDMERESALVSQGLSLTPSSPLTGHRAIEDYLIPLTVNLPSCKMGG